MTTPGNEPTAPGDSPTDPPPLVDEGSEPSTGRRLTHQQRMAAIIAVVLLIGGSTIAAILLATSGPNTDSQYLSAIQSAGDTGQFPNDAAAVAHGHAVCDALKNGGKVQGSGADEIGVRYYCQSFGAGFKLLRTITVNGTYALIDTSQSAYFPSITASGGGCSGTGGYSDVGPLTAVLVKNDAGTLLAQTQLGQGSGDSTRCTFNFSFTITEGESDYTISIGSNRGDLHFTFDALNTPGDVSITLGT